MHDAHIPVLIHITFGCLAIITGFLALFLRKGSRNHRRAGNVFFAAMLIMASIAVVMAWTGTEVKAPNPGNVAGGSLALYLVLTAWRAGRLKDGEHGWQDWALFTAAILLGGILIYIGLQPDAPHRPVDIPPNAAAFVFAAVTFLSAAGDLHMLLKGVYAQQRIARHLWRMCLALWFAASSFFIGQPQVFPHWMRQCGLVYVPSLLILVLMIYWLVVAFFTKRFKRREAPPSAPGGDVTILGK